MKAIRQHVRGGPERLLYEDAPLPDPAAGEALLRVYAAGITPTELTWSERLPTIPGHDVSGVVEALGPGVSDVSLGDAVYGLIAFPRDGSAAEYVVVRAATWHPSHGRSIMSTRPRSPSRRSPPGRRSSSTPASRPGSGS